MRLNEHFEQLEARVLQLEKEVEALKAGKGEKAEKAEAPKARAKKTTTGK